MTTAEATPTSTGAHCAACLATVSPGAKFCASCGTLQRADGAGRPQPALGAASPITGERGDSCKICDTPLDPAARFCRSCGQVQVAQLRLVDEAAANPRTGLRRQPGMCHFCGAAVPLERKFCGRCGTSTRVVQASAGEVVAAEPGWYRVVTGLGLIFWGTVSVLAAVIGLVVLLVFIGISGATLGLLKTLLYAAVGVCVVGTLVVLGGKLSCVFVPTVSRARPLAIVSVALVGVSTVVPMLIALASPRAAQMVSRVAGIACLAGLVTFMLMLRQIAFYLRNYRIAQGVIGYVIFQGVGVVTVLLASAVFSSARATASSFIQLLVLAFSLLSVVWYLVIIRRAQLLIRQRLP